MTIICAIDTETTGLLKPEILDIKEQPYIWELAATKINEKGDVLDRFYAKIKPPVPIPDIITKITGIRDKDIADCNPFVSIYKEFAEFMTGVNVLTAHNLAFDREMLANELIRIDKVLQFPWPPRQICTVRETTKLNGYRLNLTKLHEYLFNKGFEGAHGASADVEAQLRCFLELVKRGNIKL